MQIEYTAQIKNLIKYVKKNFPAGRGYFYGERPTGKELEWQCMPEGSRNFIEQQMKNLPEIKTLIAAREKELKELFGIPYANPSCETRHNGLQVKFYKTIDFKDREEMLKWAKTSNVTIPTECEKSGVLVGDVIKTHVKHELKVADDVKFTVTYYRDGSPTPHCKVISRMTNEVVCTIHD